jgi:osmotically-inducible protein OsmY
MTVSEHPSANTGVATPERCAVLSAVERRLERSGYSALSRVRCEFHRESGVVHLGGAVRSYYLKQLAQELVVDVDGVRGVKNQIDVARSIALVAAQNAMCPEEASTSSGP